MASLEQGNASVTAKLTVKKLSIFRKKGVNSALSADRIETHDLYAKTDRGALCYDGCYFSL